MRKVENKKGAAMESYEYQGSFFNAFPAESRAYIMNLFCLSAREFLGVPPTVEEVLRATAARILRGYREGEPRAELLLAVHQSLTSDDALELAAFVIKRESLPTDIKSKLKVQRATEYRAQWMAAHPPSPKQLAYLKRLGCNLTPANLGEASALIESLTKKRKAA